MKRFFSILFIIGAFAFAFVQLAPVLRQSVEDRRGFQPGFQPQWQPSRPQRWAGGPQGEPPQVDVQPRFGGGPRWGGFRRGPNFGNGQQGGIQEPLKLVSQFDQNGDGWLDAEERKAARHFLEKERVEGRGRRGPAFWLRNDAQTIPEPGSKITPAEVTNFTDAGLYDLPVLRTIFLEFEGNDWERELSEFYQTDVDVPATLMVDGKSYPGVGVQLRSYPSYLPGGAGRKRSLYLSTDFIDKAQNVYGYRTLNLLRSHEDPTFLRSVLYLEAARDYIAAPKANFARLVINGESWGIYVNAQQFNKDFTKDWFDSAKGARWKVPGNARAKSGLDYLGEHAGPYKQIYEMKSKDDKKAWRALITLCRVLHETQSDQLEKELAPLLDIDGTLKFLALENALINSDSYWNHANGYDLYLDPDDRFHIIPQDVTEAFREPASAPGTRVEGRGVELDPLRGADDPSRPLLNKLLAVPSLREKYLGYVRDIAAKWLDWNKVGPVAEQYQRLVLNDVKADTHKLYSSELFARALTEQLEQQGPRGPERMISLKYFVEERQKFLLNYAATKRE